jgi:hypothetical protein
VPKTNALLKAGKTIGKIKLENLEKFLAREKSPPTPHAR